MEGLKNWIALLATITLLLMSLLAGLISAAPAGYGEPASEEKAIAEGGEAPAATPDAETIPGEEPAQEGVSTEEESTTLEKDASQDEMVAITDPTDPEGEAETSISPEGQTEPEAETQCHHNPDVPDPTSLKVTKTVSNAEAPGVTINLDKKASVESMEMKVGESKDVTFTIDVDFEASGQYLVCGSVTIENDPDYAAHVTEVEDIVQYRKDGTWHDAPLTFIYPGTTFPATPFDIAEGATVTYDYSGNFAMPVSGVTAVRNRIEITISNHPDGYHTFHYTVSFDKPRPSGQGVFLLEDIESMFPEEGLDYAVKSVEVNGDTRPLSPLSWELNPDEGPYTVEIVKTLTAEKAGEYVLNNKALIDDLEDEVDVDILVKEDGRGRICGTKWEDLNCNGRHDRGEPPLEGITIELYKNGNLVDSTITGEDGRYCFDGLALGCYKVVEVLPDGWYARKPASGEQVVHLSLCRPRACHVDFLNARFGQICGYKFLDANCNGIMDEGEEGIAGVQIKLWSHGTMRTATTDGDGWYCFDNLKPGKYKIRLVESTVPEGHYHTTKTSRFVKLCCGEEERVDFGNAEYGKIYGYKFLDADCNGVMDQGEEGIEGVVVKLWSHCGIQQTTTDADGYYCFDGLKPGLYKVGLDESTVPEGHYHTTCTWKFVKLCCGEQEEVDFGNARYLSICGHKWELDAEGNLPVEGVLIQLWLKTENDVVDDAEATELNGDGGWIKLDEMKTLADGSYCFDGLKPGTYKVVEVLDEGQAEKWYFVVPEDGMFVVELGCNQDITDLDFVNAGYLSISGHKWDDLNVNGIHNQGELGVEGVEIQLWLDGEKIRTMLTDENGAYHFDKLTPGAYKVIEVLDTEQAKEWYVLVPEEGVYAIDLVYGQSRDDVDFFNCHRRKITGYKYNDKNINGQLDDGDVPWDGSDIPIVIELWQGSTKLAEYTIDDNTGMYEFDGLLPGTYVIMEKTPLPDTVKTKADTTIVVTLPPDKDLEVSQPFLNYIEETGAETITPDRAPAVRPEQPQVSPEQLQVSPEQLPATGLNQLPLILAAGLFIIMGLLALLFGLLQLHRT